MLKNKEYKGSKNNSTNIEISVVVPVYNSSITLNELVQRLESTLSEIAYEKYELIFVNDGSKDSSWEILQKIALNNENITVINLTRNFGQHNAVMCGFTQASGKYVITLDDDLQNPPEEIPKLYNKIREGFDVVYGIFDTKKHSKFKNIGSELVQFIYRKTFKIDICITSFRMIKKSVICRILSYDKSFTYIDGLISWFTTSIGNTIVEHHKRKTGSSGYSLWKMTTLALNMMTNFSIVPLQFASMFGLASSLMGFLFGCFFLLKKILFDITVSGFASLIISVTIFSGVQLLTVGMLGEYIGRMHINVSKRPQYAVDEIVSICSSEVDDPK